MEINILQSTGKYLTVNRKGIGMMRATSMIIILLFTIINIRLAESRIFMTPRIFMIQNPWLTNEEGSKDKIENLKLVDTSSVHDKEVPMRKNSVELVQEPKHDSTPFPKGKKEYSL